MKKSIYLKIGLVLSSFAFFSLIYLQCWLDHFYPVGQTHWSAPANYFTATILFLCAGGCVIALIQD